MKILAQKQIFENTIALNCNWIFDDKCYIDICCAWPYKKNKNKCDLEKVIPSSNFSLVGFKIWVQFKPIIDVWYINLHRIHWRIRATHCLYLNVCYETLRSVSRPLADCNGSTALTIFDNHLAVKTKTKLLLLLLLLFETSKLKSWGECY